MKTVADIIFLLIVIALLAVSVYCFNGGEYGKAIFALVLLNLAYLHVRSNALEELVRERRS